MPETGQRLRAVPDGYAKFLCEKDLALPKHQPYLVRWAGEFLHFDESYGECLPNKMRTFLRYVKDDETPYCTPQYAMHIIDVIQSAYESSRTGKEIAIP